MARLDVQSRGALQTIDRDDGIDQLNGFTGEALADLDVVPGPGQHIVYTARFVEPIGRVLPAMIATTAVPDDRRQHAAILELLDSQPPSPQNSLLFSPLLFENPTPRPD